MASRRGKANMTPEQERTLLQLVAAGMPQSNAAECVDLTPQAVSKRKARNSGFLEAINKARSKGMFAHLAKILKDKDWRSSAWYLERQFPEEFARPEVRAMLQVANISTDDLAKAIHAGLAAIAKRHAPPDEPDQDADESMAFGAEPPPETPPAGVSRS